MLRHLLSLLKVIEWKPGEPTSEMKPLRDRPTFSDLAVIGAMLFAAALFVLGLAIHALTALCR